MSYIIKQLPKVVKAWGHVFTKIFIDSLIDSLISMLIIKVYLNTESLSKKIQCVCDAIDFYVKPHCR